MDMNLHAARLGGGVELPETLAFDFPTVRQLRAHVAELIAPAAHPAAPLLASGSRNQFVKLFDLSALPQRETHTIRYFDGFLGARIGPVSSLCFHPSKIMLAVGATDSVLSLFSTPTR